MTAALDVAAAIARQEQRDAGQRRGRTVAKFEVQQIVVGLDRMAAHLDRVLDPERIAAGDDDAGLELTGTEQQLDDGAG
ncbi:hypothetical protein DQE80_16335, partial [Enterococcus sp. HPCN18]